MNEHIVFARVPVTTPARVHAPGAFGLAAWETGTVLMVEVCRNATELRMLWIVDSLMQLCNNAESVA